MKLRTTSAAFSILAVSFAAHPGVARAEGNDARVVVGGEKTPVPFVPFTLADLINPDTQKPYDPSDVLRIEVEGKVTYQGIAQDFLQVMNSMEKYYCDLGTSLRNAGDGNLLEMAKNGAFDRQRIEALRLSATALRDKVKTALERCDVLSVTDLGINIETRVPFLKDDVLVVERGVRLTAQQLVDRMNYQQQTLCRLGYDLFEGVSRGASNTLERVFARRDALLRELGISSFHPTFNLAELGRIPEIAQMAFDVKKSLDEGKIPSVRTLEALVRESGATLPDEWKVPELPNIPSPELPKRRDLALKKHKTWGGINVGSRDVAAVYSNAWYEVRGQEKPTMALDARGEAKAGVYVLGNEVNVVYGNGVFTAAQASGVEATITLKVLGQDVFDPIKKSNPLSYVKSDPRAFSIQKSLPPYRANFMVGPVPVVVSAEVAGEMYIGYEVGLSLEGVHGKVVPGANVTLHVQGGAGVSGLSVGASGDVTLLDANIPVYGTASLRFEDDTPFLALAIYGDMEHRYLNGRISAYAEYPWFRCKSLTKCGFISKREEKEIFAWEGGSGTSRFFNWGMDVRPFGATMHGDLLDQTDRDELAALEEAASLEERKLATAKADRDVTDKERRAMEALVADLSSESAARIGAETSKFARAREALQQATRDLVALAAGKGQ